MNISSNVLPSIKYNTGTNAQLSVDVQPTRSISSRFRIRPKSQYEQKLINAALLHPNSRIVISQTDPQSFTIGGVKVLSDKLTKLSTSGNADSCTDHGQTIDLSNSPSQSNTMLTYQITNASSSKDANRKNIGANIHSHNNRAHNKLTITGNSTKNVANENKGKYPIQNTRLNPQANKGSHRLKLRKSSSRRRLSLDNKPEFTTSNAKVMKIYLSQKQSADINCGTVKGGAFQPSAPPCTPSLETLKKFEYIPSLSDNLAKQQVKTKLKIMKKAETEKNKVKHADRLKIELKEAKEKEVDLRKEQRRAIYALNSVMTKVENDQFERFKSDQGLRPKEYPSANVRRK